ncbi:Phosphoserine aminotransferase [hydrothermal vent metagenome]|uniref:phosphoserine transaminase n=1 Tax=hydrothermal vent metagenome TaxID=652676 RepID=A0A3B0YUL0_9ZZZZ
MSRVFNFSAGPAMVPEAVLKRASEEMLDWQGTGMSVMEMSHRGKEFMSIAEKAEADLRELLNVPSNYKVLFTQGGASTQFAAVPINLLRGKTQADYFHTGAWSKKAIAEAKRYCSVNIVANAEGSNFSEVPDESAWQFNRNAAYVHFTPNETIGGVRFSALPDAGDVPIVADMSSEILSQPVDVSRYGVIYAGAQKNIGPAGLTLVIVRDDLIGSPLEGAPSILDYKTIADNESMYNTPPTYSWYLAGLVFDWLKSRGGLSVMAEQNQRKAAKLYAAIDGSDFYANPVRKANRSLMNIPFTLANADLDKRFLMQAAEAGLITLKGHRSVGGMRASIYNAMPEEGVDALIEFMKNFEKTQA